MVDIIQVEINVFSNSVRCLPSPNNQTNKIVTPMVMSKMKNKSLDDTRLYVDLFVLMIVF